ncbi:uncharacterized protein LOC143224200 [Tachypleus tridentatus]|uniref:uncharacterized protein LOC143224200 n=1 Tax=Tachypleus tridentatus TaxID=6853 RepID=UPI003FD25F37
MNGHAFPYYSTPLSYPQTGQSLDDQPLDFSTKKSQNSLVRQLNYREEESPFTRSPDSPEHLIHATNLTLPLSLKLPTTRVSPHTEFDEVKKDNIAEHPISTTSSMSSFSPPGICYASSLGISTSLESYSSGLLTTLPSALSYGILDPRKPGKTTRPFKAYPRDPLNMPLGIHGIPLQLPFTPDVIATQSILAGTSDPSFLKFREHMLASRRNRQESQRRSSSRQQVNGRKEINEPNKSSEVGNVTTGNSTNSIISFVGVQNHATVTNTSALSAVTQDSTRISGITSHPVETQDKSNSNKTNTPPLMSQGNAVIENAISSPAASQNKTQFCVQAENLVNTLELYNNQINERSLSPPSSADDNSVAVTVTTVSEANDSITMSTDSKKNKQSNGTSLISNGITGTRQLHQNTDSDNSIPGDEVILSTENELLTPPCSQTVGRKRGRSLPNEVKDEAYWERRRKNNEAAKRSRDARRMKEDEIAIRAAFLEQENLKLRIELAALKSETAKLRCLLYGN